MARGRRDTERDVNNNNNNNAIFTLAYFWLGLRVKAAKARAGRAFVGETDGASWSIVRDGLVRESEEGNGGRRCARCR